MEETAVFNALPASPYEAGGAMHGIEKNTVQQGQGSVSPDRVSVPEIQAFISPKLFRELSWTNGQSAEAVTEGCITKAYDTLETLLALVKEPFNAWSRTQREAVKLMTVSKLYEYNGDAHGRKEFLQRAERLLSDRYGSIEAEREYAAPCAAVCVPDESDALKF